MDQVEYIDPDVINGLNLYAYCSNNPAMGYDPEGTWNWGKFWRAVAVVAVAAVAVTTITAVTVISGGTATPVLVGAGVGAITSAGTSAVTQLATTGNIDVAQLFVDASIGAVTGALGGSSIGHLGSALGNGLTEAVGSVAGDWVAGNAVDWGSAATSFATGAFFGAFSKGAQNKMSSNVLNKRAAYKKKPNTNNKHNLEIAKKMRTKNALKNMIPDSADFLFGFIEFGVNFGLAF